MGDPEEVTATVADEVPCYRCGYCLRGMGLDTRCPECGSAVRASVGRPYLAAAPTRYLQRLALGFTITVVLFVWTILSDLMFFVPERTLWEFNYYTRVRVVNMVMAVLTVAATFRLTTPLPAWRRWMPPDGLRRAARGVAFLQAFCSVLDLLTGVSSFPYAYPVESCELNTLYLLPWVLLMAFNLGYLRLLARRLPDHGLAGEAGFFMFTLSAVQWLYVPASILFYDTGGPVDRYMKWAYDGRDGLLHGLLITEIALTAGGIWFLLRWRRRVKALLKNRGGARVKGS